MDEPQKRHSQINSHLLCQYCTQVFKLWKILAKWSQVIGQKCLDKHAAQWNWQQYGRGLWQYSEEFQGQEDGRWVIKGQERQHQGTDKVSFFYIVAVKFVEQAGDDREVDFKHEQNDEWPGQFQERIIIVKKHEFSDVKFLTQLAATTIELARVANIDQRRQSHTGAIKPSGKVSICTGLQEISRLKLHTEHRIHWDLWVALQVGVQQEWQVIMW